MSSYLGINLPGLMQAAVGSKTEDFTLRVVTQGSRTSGQLTGGLNSTSVDYPCKGFLSDYSVRLVFEEVVRAEDREATLFAGSLPSGIRPKPSDLIVDSSGVVYTVVRVQSDAATSTFRCQVRV